MPAPLPAGEGHWTDLNQDAIVLGLLLECADDFVAGTVLCDKLDVPRAELLKRIDSLRARGYVIQTRGGVGYRLVEVPDQLGEAQIAPLLATGELGRKIHFFAELGSTNDEAHRLAEAGALHGEVVIAGSQTQGRGRRGHAWISPPGMSLAFSVILRPTLPPAQAHDFPPELRSTATSLLIESGEKLPRPLVCARLLEHLEEWLSLHETEGFGPVRDRFCELSSTLGRKVRITGEGEPLEGDAADLDESGALLVRDKSGAMVRVMAGEVEHCKVL